MDTGYGQTANAAAYSAQRNGNALPKAANPSCFGNIEDVTGSCSSMAVRVEQIVSRLCGLPPQDPRAEGLMSEPGTLFDAADRQARDIRNSMSRIAAALNHLESNLP